MDACVGYARLHGLFPADEMVCTHTLYNEVWAGAAFQCDYVRADPILYRLDDPPLAAAARAAAAKGGNYKTFLCRQHTQVQELQEHFALLRLIRETFHAAYLRAKEDRSIRTDVTEDVLFTVIAIGMLSAAERYAQGIIWVGHTDADYTGELRLTQEMFLNWCADKKAVSPEPDTAG